MIDPEEIHEWLTKAEEDRKATDVLLNRLLKKSHGQDDTNFENEARRLPSQECLGHFAMGPTPLRFKSRSPQRGSVKIGVSRVGGFLTCLQAGDGSPPPC